MMYPHEVDAWNATHPIGTRVEVTRHARRITIETTSGPLRQWGDWEIVELASGGCVRLESLRVLDQGFPTT